MLGGRTNAQFGALVRFLQMTQTDAPLNRPFAERGLERKHRDGQEEICAVHCLPSMAAIDDVANTWQARTRHFEFLTRYGNTVGNPMGVVAKFSGNPFAVVPMSEHIDADLSGNREIACHNVALVWRVDSAHQG